MSLPLGPPTEPKTQLGGRPLGPFEHAVVLVPRFVPRLASPVQRGQLPHAPVALELLPEPRHVDVLDHDVMRC